MKRIIILLAVIFPKYLLRQDGCVGIRKKQEFEVPEVFMEDLKEKCEYMSMNPMEYVEKKVFSYAHLNRGSVGYAYAASIYTGMLFSSYC